MRRWFNETSTSRNATRRCNYCMNMVYYCAYVLHVIPRIFSCWVMPKSQVVMLMLNAQVLTLLHWEKWILFHSTRKKLVEKYWFVVLRNLVPTARIVAEGTWYIVQWLRIFISEYSNQGPWLKLSSHRRAHCAHWWHRIVSATSKIWLL